MLQVLVGVAGVVCLLIHSNFGFVFKLNNNIIYVLVYTVQSMFIILFCICICVLICTHNDYVCCVSFNIIVNTYLIAILFSLKLLLHYFE